MIFREIALQTFDDETKILEEMYPEAKAEVWGMMVAIKWLRDGGPPPSTMLRMVKAVNAVAGSS